MSLHSLTRVATYPAAAPLLADQVLELHAARLLLLVRVIGDGTIEGLTKLAKLDFFVRYPTFFARVAGRTPQEGGAIRSEPSMIRFHYGPWDPRYYQLLAYLEAKSLIAVSRPTPRMYRFSLTPAGQVVAGRLVESQANTELVASMRAVGQLLGKQKGSALKRLVYETFQTEVAQLRLGEWIGP